jgi:hypothetical protein
MARTLADPAKTALVLVNLPEELPTTETLETIDWVTENGVVSAPTVLANRVLDELKVKVPETGVAAEIATLHTSLWAEQQKWLERLPPDAILPYMFGTFTPTEVAAHVSDALEVLR